MANLPDAVPILTSDWTDADFAVTTDPTDVNPHTQHHDDLATNLNQVAAASNAVHGFGTDPGLGYFPITQPTGVEQLDTTVPGGKLRLTAPSSNTSSNLRVMLPAPKAGVSGDAEVRSTWSAQSTAMSDGQARFQPGHSHRVTAHKQMRQRGSATSGGSTTVTDTAGAWTAGEWVGAGAFAVEHYVTLIGNGTGAGQTRRIVSNTTTALTVDSAWDTNPDNTSKYEIWAYNTRGLVLSQNIVFSAHAIINCHIWEGPAFFQVGQIDMGDYLKPGGTYVQFPWFVKSKVVGNTASVAVWKGADAETAYGTADRSASFTIPAGFEAPGMHGLYLGHMDADDWLEFDDLTVIRL